MNAMRLVRQSFAAGIVAVVLLAVGGLRGAEAATTTTEIDWAKAQQLRQKSLAGGTLTPDEQAYLDHAIAVRQSRGRGGAAEAADRETMQRLLEKRRKGETLTPAEEATARQIRQRYASKSGPAAAANVSAPREKTGLVPLTEMSAEQTYKGEDGGLYGEGRNEPPPAQLAAALAAARAVKPLDPAGRPSASGRIALLSVGMSNSTQEFSRFQEFAHRDPAKSDRVVLVDGAQGGRTAAEWARADDSVVWQTVDARMKAAGITPAQVQVVWLKQANARPTEAFPAHARKLEQDLTVLVKQLKKKFANLRLIYFSSRTYGGYASTALNPEPYAYESAFAVRWLIRRQIQGDPDLNSDPARGTVKVPVLLWGPYLWGDGTTPRKSDGLVWNRGDFREDGTHPSVTSGRDKVARLLLEFLKTDPTAKIWFRK